MRGTLLLKFEVNLDIFHGQSISNLKSFVFVDKTSEGNKKNGITKLKTSKHWNEVTLY